MLKQNKRLIGIILAVPILLLIPLVAMMFSNEVKWTSLDFTVAGVLLLATGLTLELIMRKAKTDKIRIALCIALILAFLLIWAELAVGIFGTIFGGH